MGKKIELTDQLIELETLAWAEIREGVLTLATAEIVQAAITAHAEASGQSRQAVEQALKGRVRGTDAGEGAE